MRRFNTNHAYNILIDALVPFVNALPTAYMLKLTYEDFTTKEPKRYCIGNDKPIDNFFFLSIMLCNLAVVIDQLYFKETRQQRLIECGVKTRKFMLFSKSKRSQKIAKFLSLQSGLFLPLLTLVSSFLALASDEGLCVRRGGESAEIVIDVILATYFLAITIFAGREFILTPTENEPIEILEGVEHKGHYHALNP